VAKVRYAYVLRYDKHAWQWMAKGVLWQFRTHPHKGLWRAGVRVDEGGDTVPLLCVDDAVIFAIGYEAGLITGRFGKDHGTAGVDFNPLEKGDAGPTPAVGSADPQSSEERADGGGNTRKPRADDGSSG
jgi:hypothetical protein